MSRTIKNRGDLLYDAPLILYILWIRFSRLRLHHSVSSFSNLSLYSRLSTFVITVQFGSLFP